MADQIDSWHLDKKVPVTLIATILIQTLIFGWFLSKFDSRLAHVEEQSARLEVTATARQAVVDSNRINVAVIQQNLDGIQRSLDRIEKSLENQ